MVPIWVWSILSRLHVFANLLWLSRLFDWTLTNWLVQQAKWVLADILLISSKFLQVATEEECWQEARSHCVQFPTRQGQCRHSSLFECLWINIQGVAKLAKGGLQCWWIAWEWRGIDPVGKLLSKFPWARFLFYTLSCANWKLKDITPRHKSRMSEKLWFNLFQSHYEKNLVQILQQSGASIIWWKLLEARAQERMRSSLCVIQAIARPITWFTNLYVDSPRMICFLLFSDCLA